MRKKIYVQFARNRDYARISANHRLEKSIDWMVIELVLFFSFRESNNRYFAAIGRQRTATIRCHVFAARETARSIECHLYAECFASPDGARTDHSAHGLVSFSSLSLALIKYFINKETEITAAAVGDSSLRIFLSWSSGFAFVNRKLLFMSRINFAILIAESKISRPCE